MAEIKTPQFIQEINIFANGIGHLGVSDEFELPKIQFNRETLNAGGFETRDIDPIWQALDRVRTFYRVLDAIIKANKWARDREADQLLEVKKTVTEFMNELVGNSVAIGFYVYFDPKKNTRATVTAGKFYLTVEFQDMPSIKELNIELVYVDDYSEVLINYLNQGE